MKQFWLIRHGQSTANAGEPTVRRGLPPLTPLGWEQARTVGEWFPVQPDLIVTSPFVRTKQTAEPLQNRFPTAAHEEWPIFEFTGLAAKHYEGTTGRERSPLLHEFWERCEPYYWDGEGAETLAQAIGRADTLLNNLINTPHERIAVFTHGMFVRFVYWLLIMGSAERAIENIEGFGSIRRYFFVPNCSAIPGAVNNGVITLGSVQTDHLFD